ncbi:holin [Escherichia coli]|uniref:class II holin family protein n=1 Tax=Escherichia coli TaxID=562 RepID=UPI0006A1995E|nr:class II holin family protein [Escherichia coli]EES4629264.1 holin [Escherichia coli]EES4951896.1 holin [Escherichia coli]EES6428792.1 holin [Escherichia coli]KNA40562.1 lysis protein S [Escherichia coli M114]
MVRVNNISDIATGVSYTTSSVSGGYWLLQLLDAVSPSQWAGIGVLASVFLGVLTYLTNLYFRIKEDRRKAARGE